MSAHGVWELSGSTIPAASGTRCCPNDNSWGHGYQGSPSGSGVILDPDGTILTNAHIVAEASPQRRQGGGGSRAMQPTVHVALQDGRIFEGRVISTDRWHLSLISTSCTGACII